MEFLKNIGQYKPLEIPKIRALDLRTVGRRRAEQAQQAPAIEVPIVTFPKK